MHHFNFYTEREIIPVLSSPAEVEDAHGQLGSSYMLIKRKDLKQLSTLDPGEILMIDSIGRTSWSLIALNAAREPNRHDAALDRMGTAP